MSLSKGSSGGTAGFNNAVNLRFLSPGDLERDLEDEDERLEAEDDLEDLLVDRRVEEEDRRRFFDLMEASAALKLLGFFLSSGSFLIFLMIPVEDEARLSSLF